MRQVYESRLKFLENGQPLGRKSSCQHPGGLAPTRGKARGMAARKQHYLFAHRLLPEMAYKDPAQFYKVVGSSAGNRYLQTLWKKTAAVIQQPSIETDQLFVQVLGKRLAVIEFPSPIEAPESHFAAMASIPGKKRFGFLPGPLKHYYFLLDFAAPAKKDNRPKTNLARLDKELYQFDLGPGPEPNREAFIQAVVKELEKVENEPE
jgi:hypothetical protein